MALEPSERLTPAEETGLRSALLVSSGVLLGLGMKNRFVRRLAALACVTLTAGLAVPAAQEYLEKKRETGDETLIDLTVKTTDDPDVEPIFEFKATVGEERAPDPEPEFKPFTTPEETGDTAPEEPAQPEKPGIFDGIL